MTATAAITAQPTPLQSPGSSPILCTKSSIWLLNPKIPATADYCHFSATLLQRLSKPPSRSLYLSFWLQTQLRVLEQGDTSTHALCLLLTWTPILHFAVRLSSLPKETYEGTTWPKRLLEGFLHHGGAPTCCYIALHYSTVRFALVHYMQYLPYKSLNYKLQIQPCFQKHCGKSRN